MKILTKGIYYYKPKTREKYIEQNLNDDVLDEYINDDLVMLWHDCDKWSRREGLNRVSMKHQETEGDESHYECAHCGFKYSLDNNFKLIESV